MFINLKQDFANYCNETLIILYQRAEIKIKLSPVLHSISMIL